MNKPVIFYGAGTTSKATLKHCLSENIVPVCFVDADESKQYNFLETDGKRFEILPLNEALRRWPDANVWITTSPTWYGDIYEILLSKGLPKERIRLPDSFKISLGTSKHCPDIGHFFVLDGLGFRTCCGPNVRNWASTGDFKRDLEQYYAFCEDLRNSLNDGKLTSCADCSMLSDGRSEEPLKIKKVNLGTGLPGGDRCNGKCCYCVFGETVGARNREETVLDIFQQMAKQLDIDYLVYTSGEISISPYKDEIVKIWRNKGWKGAIATNAFVYCDGITALLQDGLARLVISLDAGTVATFAKVKGVDCFVKVLENVERYSEAGEVELKYVVLDGVNDNIADADSFVAISKKIGADIIISRDIRVSHTPMTDSEYSTISRLVNQCQAERLRYSFTNLLDCIRHARGDALTADGFSIPTASASHAQATSQVLIAKTINEVIRSK